MTYFSSRRTSYDTGCAQHAAGTVEGVNSFAVFFVKALTIFNLCAQKGLNLADFLQPKY